MKLYVIAGEDSGDLHASNMIRALAKRDPSLEIRGVGGDQMAAQDAELIAHIRDINFMGFWEVIQNLKTIQKLFKVVKDDIKQWQPEAVVLIDYPGFNLRIAKFIHALGIKVYFYISPQVWAWKKGRVKTIKKYIDEMFVILPFEKEFYAKEGLEVNFVGHPLLDVISPKKIEPNTNQRPHIALLPGSRKQEIKRMLPLMLKLPEIFPQCDFSIAGAPSRSPEFYKQLIGDQPIELVMNQTYDLFAKSDFAVVTSGTATLEAALFNVPQVVCYKGAWISYQIGKRLVNIDFISLVNLILARKAVTELIQNDYTLENVVQEIQSFLNDPNKQKQFQEDYTELRTRLGESGASERVAQAILL